MLVAFRENRLKLVPPSMTVAPRGLAWPQLPGMFIALRVWFKVAIPFAFLVGGSFYQIRAAKQPILVAIEMV